MRAAQWLSVAGCLLVLGCLWAQQPQDEQEPGLTLGPQVMTYEELADALSTSGRRVLVAPRLKQSAVLVYLKNRPWSEAIRLMEYGLDLKFTLHTDPDGTVYWLMDRAPEAMKRDARFFDQYVRVATRAIQAQLRRYDELLARPLDELQKGYIEKGRHDPNLPELPEDATIDTPLPAGYLQAMRQWNRLLWAQSLDGYVMLRWMRQRWNESLTRRLLLERSLIMLQPRALGVEGLPDEELRDFLHGAGQDEDYNLVIGVVGWDNRWRWVIPFCDLIS
ncbi:MAG: hypothetical protein NZL85_04720, partial [Fimbriimonadales bacterium]|nr:hypothetical protein [Fimbriimonadales bacterium]